ncbi:MAG: DUF1223 domain-containing protein [Bacteroidota bacterium]|nr:DUF1223 domain-containing protein [Bacteroidota bacterium]
MKRIVIVFSFAGIAGLAFIMKKKPIVLQTGSKSVPVAGRFEPVAVLELFTSEVCSSCPSADKLLPQLAKLDSNIITLSFHVDYWNRLGWTDPFSNREYSERQRTYASQLNLESVYTPQLVVNGEYELVGSNRSNAETAIKKALKEKSLVQIDIIDVKSASNKVSFISMLSGDYKKTNLLAAIVQKQASTKVRAGENGGATLSHSNIVRLFSTQVAAQKNTFELTIPEKLIKDDWQLVVYTQQKNDLKITGAVIFNADKN